MDALVGVCRRRACSYVREQDGFAATEYAVVLALFLVIVLGVMWLLGGNLTTTFSAIADNVSGASDGVRGPSSGTSDPTYISVTHFAQPKLKP